MAQKMVHIDGSLLEGGGQILRTCAALSAILKIPVKISNIRAGRSTPGLRPQHLQGLKLVADICQGTLAGDAIGSTEIELSPRTLSGGNFLADTKTAGSITLLLQAALPCLLFAPIRSELILKGGTDAEMAPPIDYFVHVFKPMAEHFGIDFTIDIIRRGFYPKGGGEVRVSVNPVKALRPVVMDSSHVLKQITGRSFVAGTLPVKIAHEMADSAIKVLKPFTQSKPVSAERVKENESKAFGNGVAILLVGETEMGAVFGGSAIGKRGVPASQVGQLAAETIVDAIKRSIGIDEHLQDQVIIFMALAEGKSRILTGPLSLHTQTAIHFTSLLTGAKFTVTDRKSSPETFVIECDGIGWKNSFLH